MTDFTQDDLKAIKYALELATEIIDGMIDVEKVPENRLIDCIGENNIIICYGTYNEIQASAEQWVDDSDGCCDLEIQQYDSSTSLLSISGIKNDFISLCPAEFRVYLWTVITGAGAIPAQSTFITASAVERYQLQLIKGVNDYEKQTGIESCRKRRWYVFNAGKSERR